MPALVREATSSAALKVPFPPNCDIHGATSNDRFTLKPVKLSGYAVRRLALQMQETLLPWGDLDAALSNVA